MRRPPMRRSPLGRTLTLGAALAAFAATTLLAAPAAQAGGGGCHEPTTEGSGTTVEMTNLCYTPTILRVEPGDTVTFTNVDGYDHPTHGRSGSAPDTRFYLDGQQDLSGTVTFDEPGTYPYACMVHPGMVGQIVVGDGVGEAVPVAASGAAGDAEAAGEEGEDKAAAPEARVDAAEPVAAVEPGGAGVLQMSGAAVAGAAVALIGSALLRRRKKLTG